MNLPRKVVISNSLGQATNQYIYSAAGTKLSVSKNTHKTDYVGNKIYENGTLKRILVDGGYYENGKYYFYIQDHLGNNRVVADQNGTVVQSMQYYPFGMSFADEVETSKQPYKYGGKELDKERGLNWYDFEARNYDTALGRFTTVDPLAEKYYSISPYAYCNNNPMIFVDPDGESPAKILKAVYNIGKRAYKTYKAGGKLDVGKAILQESVNIVDNVTTLFDSDASTLDKVFAGVDLVTGFGSEAKKVTKALGIADDVKDAGKVIRKEPTGRAGKTLAKENGVTVQSYGTNDVHKPAHAHVKGGGKEVRIGPNGKPLEGQPELTNKQKSVVENHKKEIRKEINKVGKANKAIEDYTNEIKR